MTQPKQCKTPRCLLEEAATAIGTDISKLDTEEAIEQGKTGWVKSAEFLWEHKQNTGQISLIGVCSIGAIALATLDNCQLGEIVPKDSLASFETAAINDPNVVIAALYLLKAIDTRIRWRRLLEEGNEWAIRYKDAIHAFGWEGLHWLAKQPSKPFPPLEHRCSRRVKCDFDVNENGRFHKPSLISLLGDLIAAFNDSIRTTWKDVDGVFIQAIKFAIQDEEKGV